MRFSARAAAVLAPWALAGCCSTDPAGLAAPDADARRERLACMAEAARAGDLDPAARRAATDAARAWLDPAREPDPAVRATAHLALGALGDRGAGGALARRLVGAERDPAPAVRAAAAAALGALRAAEAPEALRAALRDDPDRSARIAAARELATSPGDARPTAEALVAALRDDQADVRHVARRSLRTLHGADLGAEPAAWADWLRSLP